MSAVLNSANAEKKEIVQPTDQFEFTYVVELPQLEQPGTLWLPLARSDSFQNVDVQTVSAPTRPRRVREREFANRVLVLAVRPEDSGQKVKIQYRVHRKEKGTYRGKQRDFDRALKPDRLVPTNETFRTIAFSLTKDLKTELERGRALYDHVLKRMRYDKTGSGWGKGDANHACEVGAGNCTDFHAYFIALARSVGIPARFAIGYTIPADRDGGEIAGYHCWAEFEADGKWVPVDISEAWKSPSLADYYFGHHPANRFEITVGRDLIVEPAPASGPINFLIYPILEVNGQRIETKNQFSFHR